jgi:FKBP-type peptidyl-prolyl cis-trans isomerase
MMKVRFPAVILVSLIVFSMFSCGDEYDATKLRQRELELLDAYIKEHNITVKPTKTGLYYMERVKGTGDTAKVNDKVYVYYRTWLIDGTLVDQNIDSLGRYYDPLAFNVVPVGASASVVKGLNEGVQFMQTGTIADLIIPSELGYGESTTSGLPAFSTLLMEVRISKIYKASGN